MLSPLQQPGLQSALIEGSEFQAIQDCNVIFQDYIEVWQFVNGTYVYMFKSLKSVFNRFEWLQYNYCELPANYKSVYWKVWIISWIWCCSNLETALVLTHGKSQDDSSVFLEVSTDNINFYSPSKFHLHSRNLVQSMDVSGRDGLARWNPTSTPSWGSSATEL